MKRFKTLLKENCITFIENQNLSEVTTFRLGGLCNYFLLPKSYQELTTCIKLINDFKYKYFVLGNGSNVLFKDHPTVKIVISLKNLPSFLYCKKDNVYVSANTNFYVFNKFLKDNELAGFEFSFGIPASIGGAIKGNAGAFGFETCQFLHSITILDNKTNKIKKILAKNIKYSYRQTNIDGIVLDAVFKFKKGSYYEISRLQNQYLDYRKQTQPFNAYSAGSIFKHKDNYIPAKLIDELGLKGTQVGGAMISDKHAGFIIKKDNTCTSADVLKLIENTKKEVKKAYKISLEEEIIVI